MADPYWEKFYSDVGIPPVIPNKLTVDQMYEGIYPALSPPSPLSYTLAGRVGLGAVADLKGDTTYRAPKITLPNTAPGPAAVPKYQERLPALPAGLPIQDPGKNGLPVNMPHRLAGEPFNTFSDLDFKGSGPFKGDYAASMRFASAPQTAPKTIPKAAPDYRGYTASMRFASPPGSDAITLAADPASDASGQNMADSLGKVVKTPGGKIYQPRQGAGKPRTLPQVAPRDMPGQRPGIGGLFGALFGNGGQRGGLFGGAPQAQAPRTAAGVPIAAPGVIINNAVHGTTASGSTGDYGSSPGQITAGLQPGERKYNADTNSWGLKR